MRIDDESPFVDISIVTYNSAKWLNDFFVSLKQQMYSSKKLNVYIRDNGSTDDTVAICDMLMKKYAEDFSHIEINVGKNIGFGAGHNDNLQRSKEKFFLVTNVDLTFELKSIVTVIEAATHDEENVASWEFRQKPFEHPKYYNPITLETAWSSSACILFRRSALEKVHGYEEKLFLYGEDVELSYRLRDNGFILKYCPRAVCWHYTYEHAHEIKPQQFFGSTMANVLIRCRYGSFLQAINGFFLYLKLFAQPVPIKNKTRLLFKNWIKVFCQAPYFLSTRKKSRACFPISGWDYEIAREGAFYEYARNELPALPVVSVIIRTFRGRLEWLKQAVTSVLNQTYPTIELVIVEDGSNLAESFVNEVKKSAKFANVIYKSIPKGGRCVAGNTGLSLATGDFINFLDDDDLFFADHIEVLVEALIKNPDTAAAYAIAYQVPTKVVSIEPLCYEECAFNVEYKQKFSRFLLCEQNYFPIQTVLFRRFLYEKNGGFDEALDYLEDWDLWIRFALKNSFFYVEKLTSLYRVPADPNDSLERQKLLESYYAKVVAKQEGIFLDRVSVMEVVSYGQEIKNRMSLGQQKISIVKRIVRKLKRIMKRILF